MILKSILVKIAKYLLSAADKIDVQVRQLLIKVRAFTSRPVTRPTFAGSSLTGCDDCS